MSHIQTLIDPRGKTFNGNMHLSELISGLRLRFRIIFSEFVWLQELTESRGLVLPAHRILNLLVCIVLEMPQAMSV